MVHGTIYGASFTGSSMAAHGKPLAIFLFAPTVCSTVCLYSCIEGGEGNRLGGIGESLNAGGSSRFS